ncbi:MAG: hypothetical protein QM802_11130 [Agriterribacter sp.]
MQDIHPLKKIIATALLFFAYASSLTAQNEVKLDRTEKMSFIENEAIKVGIDLNLGGAITYLADKRKGENLINNSDWGRQVQMSFYSGPVPFEPDGKKANPAWTFIGWNPIQSGDVAGNKSRVLEHKNTGTSIYVKCIPMHWPLNNVPGECTYECWIKLDGNAVKITSRIVNNRPDKKQYEARGQELPAVYTNAPWHRLITYRGEKPFTNDTLSTIANHNFPENGNIQWASWQATESWAANVDDNDFGLGVWNESVQRFSGGYYGDKNFKGGSRDAPTAYIAPNSIDILDYNITYDYNYALIVGDLKQIRDYVYQHHHSNKPAYDFKNSRLQWYYQGTTDQGWPIKNGLHIQLKKGATMIGPVALWKADDAPVLKLEAVYPQGAHKLKIYWKPFGKEFEEANSIAFDFVADGKKQVYTVPLHPSSNYKGMITQLKIVLDETIQNDDNKTVIIKSIVPGK